MNMFKTNSLPINLLLNRNRWDSLGLTYYPRHCIKQTH